MSGVQTASAPARGRPIGAWLALLACLTLAACSDKELYRNLTQRDANEMLALLKRDGIDVTREEQANGSYRLMVGDAHFVRAVEILSQSGYPRETFRSLAEVFPGEGIIVTPFEQRARMMFALNQELSKTITAIDGVISARVQIAVPEVDLRGQPQSKPTAAVVIHHRPGIDGIELRNQVRLIVANAVQNLNFRDVSIALFESTGAGRERAAQPPAPAAAPALATSVAQTAPPIQAAAGDEAPARGGGGVMRMALWIGAAVLAALAILLALRQTAR
jgi:type III secretion protein J